MSRLMSENYTRDRTDLASPGVCQRHEAWLKKPPGTSSDSDEQAREAPKRSRRTLIDGHVPIVHLFFSNGGLRTEQTLWSAIGSPCTSTEIA